MLDACDGFQSHKLTCGGSVSIHFKQDDLFDYFSQLSRENKLPTFDALEAAARRLYRAYSTHKAVERALADDDPDFHTPGGWEETVPIGSGWTPIVADTPEARKYMQYKISYRTRSRTDHR